ncbi:MULTISPECIES: hypothetical protein [Pseudomonas]|uniref:hypothetical protein n=1 Tax=Pseudomonas TaxID=286 RepID=UPI00070D6FD3|nr:MULTISPECIES: hypothetical protein [Pseudomonas]KQW19739.1 hypothetical protein ASC85_07760 [Pseudomonas sp. Root401]WHS57313.1 hypothetical protein QLH64_30315 [Pseudomonas brassicacearum]
MNSHVKTLEAIVIYIFFLGMATGSFALAAAGYIFANKEMGLLTLVSAVIIIGAGYLGVSCYKRLRESLLALEADLPEAPAKQDISK